MRERLFCILIICTLFSFVSFSSCSSEDKKIIDPEPEIPIPKPDPKPSFNVPTATGISDLALIYHGNDKRADWNTKDLQPFIYRVNEEGLFEWQFDGLLFLEIFATLNGIDYNIGCEVPWSEKPTKSVWDWLLDVNFAEGRGVKAAEQILDSLARDGYVAPYKRQVVFSIPNPVYGKSNFGIIDGKVLDFNKTEDRITGALWFVEQTLNRWEESEFQHLNLEGFYWLHETIDYENEDDKVIQAVQKELKKKGFPLVWIPYNWADGTENSSWPEIGFDIAYQQPNYFFPRNDGTYPELWILERAINHAKDIGMFLELEFDENIRDPQIMERLHTYIDKFEEGEVWDNMPVAYYHGDNAFGALAKSTIPNYVEAYKRLSNIIAKRHGKFVKIID